MYFSIRFAQHWKQTVEYYFTSDSTNGKCFKPIMDSIITRSEAVGLKVHAVVSDMGSTNQAMWKSYGINAGRYSTTINKCEHPVDSTRKLFFFHDCIHAFKIWKKQSFQINL